MKKAIVLLSIITFSHFNIAVTIKIGSIAPARSPWDKALKHISREWKKISKGKVNLKIFSGGIAGSERAMIKKIKIGTIHGALFSNVGLSSIYPDFYVLNIPLMLKSDKEFEFVIKGLKPVFEKNIEKKGYKIIIWSMAGWIRFFTQTPVYRPSQLKKQKLFFTTGNPIVEESWKNAGFNTVPIELKDLMMALQSKMVNAFFMPPLVAASGQYFALAPNMMSVKVAPVYGAVVISKKKWDIIPEKYKRQLINSAQDIALALDGQTKILEKQALKTMRKHGLKLNEITDKDMSLWNKESMNNVKYLKGKLFSEDVYNLTNSLIEKFRRK